MQDSFSSMLSVFIYKKEMAFIRGLVESYECLVTVCTEFFDCLHEGLMYDEFRFVKAIVSDYKLDAIGTEYAARGFFASRFSSLFRDKHYKQMYDNLRTRLGLLAKFYNIDEKYLPKLI